MSYAIHALSPITFFPILSNNDSSDKKQESVIS